MSSDVNVLEVKGCVEDALNKAIEYLAIAASYLTEDNLMPDKANNIKVIIADAAIINQMIKSDDCE
ncbi:MAG: hypothetical protein QM504_08060 [Pseudomonadota bacterium]